MKMLSKNLSQYPKCVLSISFLLLICSFVIFSKEPALVGPRNVILLIGDGMDDQQITIARNYLVGAKGRLNLDTLPVRSASQVLTVDEKNPNQVIYVADSANSATAIATGVATSQGRIATTAYDDKDIPTIVELAEVAGLRTGIVSTGAITDATPASFVAHVNQRGCQGPNEMIGAISFDGRRTDCSRDLQGNGGRGSIAEQLAKSDVEVLLGGGLKYFRENISGSGSGETVKQLAEKNNFQLITNRGALKNLALQQKTFKKKLLGLFSEGSMPVKFIGESDREATKVALSENGEFNLPDPFACFSNPEFKEMPTLKEMTQAALGYLSHDNEKGFFLMVESASIDKEAHIRRPCGHIGETLQLDEALSSALVFAEQHPGTLILVTADHGQAAQLIPQQSLFTNLGIPIYSPGYFARIKTPEGGVFGVNYATSNYEGEEEHSGVQVPLYASGSGSQMIPTYVQQPDIFGIMARHLRLLDQPGG